MVRIIGLDPGLQVTGWGIIESQGTRLIHVAHGIIKSDPKLDLATRVKMLFDGLLDVLNTHQPDEAAVEETFMNNNPASALKLGQARGVVLLAPAFHGISVAEYSANRIKKSVVGVGHAEKDQVSAMVRLLLPQAGAVKLDAADALATAICHAHFRETNQLWGVGT